MDADKLAQYRAMRDERQKELEALDDPVPEKSSISDDAPKSIGESGPSTSPGAPTMLSRALAGTMMLSSTLGGGGALSPNLAEMGLNQVERDNARSGGEGRSFTENLSRAARRIPAALASGPGDMVRATGEYFEKPTSQGIPADTSDYASRAVDAPRSLLNSLTEGAIGRHGFASKVGDVGITEALRRDPGAPIEDYLMPAMMAAGLSKGAVEIGKAVDGGLTRAFPRAEGEFGYASPKLKVGQVLQSSGLGSDPSPQADQGLSSGRPARYVPQLDPGLSRDPQVRAAVLGMQRATSPDAQQQAQGSRLQTPREALFDQADSSSSLPVQSRPALAGPDEAGLSGDPQTQAQLVEGKQQQLQNLLNQIRPREARPGATPFDEQASLRRQSADRQGVAESEAEAEYQRGLNPNVPEDANPGPGGTQPPRLPAGANRSAVSIDQLVNTVRSAANSTQKAAAIQEARLVREELSRKISKLDATIGSRLDEAERAAPSDESGASARGARDAELEKIAQEREGIQGSRPRVIAPEPVYRGTSFTERDDVSTRPAVPGPEPQPTQPVDRRPYEPFTPRVPQSIHSALGIEAPELKMSEPDRVVVDRRTPKPKSQPEIQWVEGDEEQAPRQAAPPPPEEAPVKHALSPGIDILDVLGKKDAAQHQPKPGYEGGVGPEWIRHNRKKMVEYADKIGLSDKIEDLASEGLTAKQIAQKLSTDEDVVRAVRDARGIPAVGPAGVGLTGVSLDQGEAAEFAEWKKRRGESSAAGSLAPSPDQLSRLDQLEKQSASGKSPSTAERVRIALDRGDTPDQVARVLVLDGKITKADVDLVATYARRKPLVMGDSASPKAGALAEPRAEVTARERQQRERDRAYKLKVPDLAAGDDELPY